MELHQFFLYLAIILIAARLFSEIAGRHGVPSVIGELLAGRQQAGDPAMVKAAGAVSVLLSPGEMGELFKVIALGKGVTEPLRGFARGDRTHAL